MIYKLSYFVKNKINAFLGFMLPCLSINHLFLIIPKNLSRECGIAHCGNDKGKRYTAHLPVS